MKSMKIFRVLLAVSFMLSMLASVTVSATESPNFPAVRYSDPKSPAQTQKDSLETQFPGVICFGDSLTQGVTHASQDGDNVKSYVRRLGELLSENLIEGYDAVDRAVNFGIQGDNVNAIVARSGAVTVKFRNDCTVGGDAGSTFPSTCLELADNGSNGSTDRIISKQSYINMQSESAYAGIKDNDDFTITVDGVQFTVDQYNNFVRISDGEEKTWSTGQEVMYFEYGNKFDNYIPVIFIGYNNGPEWCWENKEAYSGYIDAIINKYDAGNGHKNFVIIVPHFAERCYGLVSGNECLSTIKLLENYLIDKYGDDHVIAVRDAMNKNGLSEFGLKEIEGNDRNSDTFRIAKGATPYRLMSKFEADSWGATVHYNSYGVEFVARAVYQKLYDQGTLDTVIDILGSDIPKSTGHAVPDDSDNDDDDDNDGGDNGGAKNDEGTEDALIVMIVFAAAAVLVTIVSYVIAQKIKSARSKD